jgi:hypothetical protein
MRAWYGSHEGQVGGVLSGIGSFSFNGRLPGLPFNFLIDVGFGLFAMG